MRKKILSIIDRIFVLDPKDKRAAFIEETGLDPELPYSKRFFQVTVFIIVFTYSLFAVQYLLLKETELALLQLVVVGMGLASWQIFKWSKSTTIAGSIVLFFATLSAAARAYRMGGVEAPVFYLFPLVPVFTSILMPLRYAAFWSGAYLSVAIGFELARRNGVVIESAVSKETVASVRIFSIIAVQSILVIMMYYLRNIHKKYREQIQSQKERKAGLLRALSHDVASPMTVVSLVLERYRENLSFGPGDLEKIEWAVGATRAMVSQVREIEAIESGKIKVKQHPVSLAEIVKDVFLLQEEFAKAKGINLFFTPLKSDSETPIDIVLADRQALTIQVLNNLVSNSVKFTHPGGKIEVSVHRLEKREGRDDCLALCVQDDGIGIPEHILTVLFDPEKQTTRRGTKGERGTGFGMPLVKSYLDNFFAKITVDSKNVDSHPNDHGTTIWIEFPKFEIPVLPKNPTEVEELEEPSKAA